MKVLLFGATGMVGQGVLRECLLAPDVEQVLAVGRTPTGQSHAKLKEFAPKELFELTPHEDALRGFDACFFCLGVSAAGMVQESRNSGAEAKRRPRRFLQSQIEDLFWVFMGRQRPKSPLSRVCSDYRNLAGIHKPQLGQDSGKKL